MNKKLQYIFFAALLTASGIILFQLYWVYNAYKVNEGNFEKVAASALQKSIDQCLFKDAFSLTHDNPAVAYFAIPKDSLISKSANDNGKSGDTALKTALMKKATVTLGSYLTMISDSAIMRSAQMIIASSLPAIMKTSIQPDTLLRIYKQELNRNNIHVPVQLVMHDSSAHAIAAYIGPTEKMNRVTAHFSKQREYLLKQTIVPILVSFLLMVLTASCLWYMLRVIWRQKQLDDIKNDFINNMTHELKTPISILKTTHEALLHFGEVSDMEKTIRYLQANTEELIQLENNVERILQIASYEAGNRKPTHENIELEKLIRAVIQRFAVNPAYEIVLKYDLPERIVTSDKYAIETILINLLDNAIKYSGEVNNMIVVIVSTLENGWQLSVTDNGEGIHAKQLPFIFDKFFRVPTGNLHNVKGFGLGLSYVREVVSSLEGSIQVQSKSGIGTTFTIQFPAAWKK